MRKENILFFCPSQMPNQDQINAPVNCWKRLFYNWNN